MSKISLTQQYVNKASCPPGKTKEDYFDTKISGLLLKVLKSGRRTYYVRFKSVRGKVKEKRLADASKVPLQEMRAHAKELLAQIELGNDPFADRAALKEVPTFAEFVSDQYMPYAKVNKRSWNVDEWNLRLHVLPVLGHLYLDDISKQHAIELVRLHRQHPDQFAPASTNRMISVCRRVFSCALQWDVPGLRQNPMEAVQTLTENNQRDRYLTHEELNRLLAALNASRVSMLKHIVWMLILTGARKSEVLNAKWQDFDIARRQWTIQFNKSGKTRYVPLSEGAIRQLSLIRRIEGCDYAFPNAKTKRPYVNIFSAWDTVRAEAGLSDVRIHDLRHSFASFLINAGYSIYTVQKILGHSNIKTTQRYAHLSQETVLGASNMVSALVTLDSSLHVEAQSRDALMLSDCA